MTYLDEFSQWLKDHPNHEPLPQAIAQVYNMGFGSDDPNWQRLVESWKKRHEEQCNCDSPNGGLKMTAWWNWCGDEDEDAVEPISEPSGGDWIVPLIVVFFIIGMCAFFFWTG
ncbi:MAG: hypothetical protein ACXADB_05990 [Candidatus Hermodarchaeia archaeon]